MLKNTKKYIAVQFLILLSCISSTKAVDSLHSNTHAHSNYQSALQELEQNYKTFILKTLPYLKQGIDSVPKDENNGKFESKETNNVYEKCSNQINRYFFNTKLNGWAKTLSTDVSNTQIMADNLIKVVKKLGNQIDVLFDNFKKIPKNEITEDKNIIIQKIIDFINQELGFDSTTSVDEKNDRFKTFFQLNPM